MIVDYGKLLECIKNNLTEAPQEQIKRDWAVPSEHVEWEISYGEGKLICTSINSRIDEENIIVYPEMVYRWRKGTQILDEARLPIAMRCLYPQQFRSLITSHGFNMRKEWGGYNNEPYGQGPELVIQFERGSQQIVAVVPLRPFGSEYVVSKFPAVLC
jgi:hypothetical protein